jgi:RNA polymerase sigma factor (sigma-70 family)
MYEQHGAALVLYARQWCNAPDDALQEAMLELAKLPEQPRDMLAWIYTTTKRRAMNIARAEQRRARHHAIASEQREQWFEFKPLESPTTNSHDSLGPTVAAGLERLGNLERELLVARIWGNLTFEQLGKLAGCSTSAAHRKFLAALEKLKTLVTESEVVSDRPARPEEIQRERI